MAERTTNLLETLPAPAGGREPGWLGARRAEAAARLADLGLPTARNEEWKHTPVANLLDRGFAIAAPAGERPVPGPLPELGPDAIRVVFVDGRISGDAAAGADLPAGVRVESLARALATADGVPGWLTKCAAFETRSLTAMNTAYMTDGALIVLDRNAVLDRPLHLVFVTTDEAAGRIANVRNLVVAGPGSEATVVEHHVGGGADAVVNVVTEIAVEANAHVRHVKLQEEGPATVHLGSVDAIVGRDGRFDHHSVATGGRLGRTEARVELASEGAECDLFGVYLGRDEQIQDQLTLVTHAVPRGTSRQVYKGVLDGKARGVFNGLVVVREGAQKTNAEQHNRNIVLSETADAHARPQLDISADDVKCAHGATVGRLDAASLFYLRSRGIDEAQARRLLIRAFASDVLAAIPEGSVRATAERIVSEWLTE